MHRIGGASFSNSIADGNNERICRGRCERQNRLLLCVEEKVRLGLHHNTVLQQRRVHTRPGRHLQRQRRLGPNSTRDDHCCHSNNLRPLQMRKSEEGMHSAFDGEREECQYKQSKRECCGAWSFESFSRTHNTRRMRMRERKQSLVKKERKGKERNPITCL